MPLDRVAFNLWNASVRASDILVLRTVGRVIELQLRGGNGNLRSLVLQL